MPDISKEQLYEAFGELLYAIVIADGIVQDSELEAVQKALEDHPWASQIQWSFDYEMDKEHGLKDSYFKALETCKTYGPSPEYTEFLDILSKIAQSDQDFDAKEGRLISNFQKSLRAHFLEYLDQENLRA